MRLRILLLALCLITTVGGFAAVVGSVRGVIHDPQHRPVQNAMVMLKAKTSDWSTTADSDANGNFAFNAVPLGEYVVTVVGPGFEQAQQNVSITSSSQPVLHFALNVATAKEMINVSGTADSAPTDSSTPTTIVDRLEIAQTPGADRSNSMAMITNFVPGAYMTHDQLHIRGGHQTSWLIDGALVPNTNIASNVGPQFDPKDIDSLEVSRGGYGAEFGDRTYGVFNVVPRTGFERNRQAELVLSAGNFWQTNDQFSLGSHSERFAYYASVNDNRSNLGIQTPVPQVVHDAANGYGGFGSLIFNIDPSNQLRLVTSLREDYYQIPYDPFPNDIEFFLGTYFQLTNADDGFAVLSLQPSELRQWGRRPYRCNPASCVDLWRGAGQLQREFSEERFSGGRIQLLPAQQRGSGSDVSGRKRERAVHGRGASLR